MKKGLSQVITLVGLLCTSFLTSIFYFAIYNLYFDSIDADLTVIVVHSHMDEADLSPKGQRRVRDVLARIDSWAKENQASVFYLGHDPAGVGVMDYAKFLQNTLQVDFDGKKDKTVIIRKPVASWGTLVQDGILFPGVYDYKVQGEYDPSGTFFETSFFYPLQNAADLTGNFFVSQLDPTAISEFLRLFEPGPWKAEYYNYKDQHMSLGQILLGMLQESTSIRTLLVTFIGNLFCTAFALSMFYREIHRYLVVHHLYGATYPSLFGKVLLTTYLVASLGTFLAYLLAKAQLTFYNPSSFAQLAWIGAALNLAFLTLLQICIFWRWRQKRKALTGGY